MFPCCSLRVPWRVFRNQAVVEVSICSRTYLVPILLIDWPLVEFTISSHRFNGTMICSLHLLSPAVGSRFELAQSWYWLADWWILVCSRGKSLNFIREWVLTCRLKPNLGRIRLWSRFEGLEPLPWALHSLLTCAWLECSFRTYDSTSILWIVNRIDRIFHICLCAFWC
jgi:hypothetical protein